MNKYTKVVLLKELKDTFRDKKTIFSSMIIPIIIFPLLAFVIGIGSSDLINEGKKPVEIALISQEENGLTKYLNDNKEVKILDKDNPNEALEKLKVKSIVKIGKDFDKKISKGEKPNIEILYNQSSQKSDIAHSRIQQIISNYSQSVVLEKLKKAGVDSNILEPINVKSIPVEKKGGQGLAIFSMLLPFMLTIWSAVGGIPAATDLGAGEKERQTLEPLLTTKASRMSILVGKYFTVFIAGAIATLASLLGFIIATKINPNFMGEGAIIPLKSILVIIVVCIELALAFSSIELAISFYARNFKEAQTYLSPVSIILMVPAYITMFVDGRAVPEYYFYIPVVNTIGIIKESIVSIFNVKHIVLTTSWNIIYILIFLFISIKIFKKESVIFRS